MQCDICLRTGGHKLPFLCPTDARNVLYEPRLENARILLEKEALDHQITAITSPTTAAKPINASETTSDARARWGVELAQAERDISVDRTQQIIAQADELRLKIEGARTEIAYKKAIIARRKSELSSVTSGIESRRAKHLEEIEKKIKITKYRWNQMHATTVESRAFLCAEAAKLYGLCRLKERDVWLDEYRIAGIPIVDLRAMNGASAAQITTSLSNIAHLLVLSTHYLSLRLPAEVTLPHRDYPLPTIMSLSSSYIYTNIPFPGTPVQSNSPSASRTEVVKLPRPRPLSTTKPLPLLAKEDPGAHSLFLEGATLLAYDIAWVCKSQGVHVATSFEGICALGRNLFNLLIGTSPRPAPGSPSTATTPTKLKSKDIAENSGSGDVKKVPNSSLPVGHFSHGTAHSFLGSPEGNAFVRGFKLPAPRELADKLRSRLLSEMSSAEWEIVDQNAWEDGKDLEDDGVMVGARKDRPGRILGGGLKSDGAIQSFMSMRTVMDAVEIVPDAAGLEI